MIYKYYDEGTLQPVTDRTLKFATVPDLNDPFENLGRPKLSTSNFEKQLSRTEKQLRELDISQKLPEKQRQAIVKKVINKTRAQFDGAQHFTATLRLQTRLQESTASEIGILSLTPSRTNGLMWSHYANKHQGYVLGFDETHEWFNPPEEAGAVLGRIKNITYSSERVRLRQGIQNLEEAFKPFFVKSLDWSYEDEKRVLYPLKACTKINPTLHIRNYPPEMLKEVVFGYRSSQLTINKIKQALEGHDISFTRAVPSSATFDVEIESEETFHENLVDYEASLKEQAEAAGIDVSSLKLGE